MTDAHDAPERIWAEPDYDLGWTDRGEWFAEGHGMIEIGAVEYVRHDLAPQWREISSAPRDGTVIDLWMKDERGNEWRVTDAYFVRDREERFVQFGEDGRSHDSWRRRDGWFAPDQDYDQDGFCDFPKYFNAHPCQKRWIFTEATHWMPLPQPPEDGQ